MNSDTFIGLPSEEEIEELLQQVQDKLELKNIDLLVNSQVKIGYQEAVNVLADDRKTYAGIDMLPSDQSRAIATLFVDFLNGEIEARKLLDFGFGLTVPKKSIESRLKK